MKKYTKQNHGYDKSNFHDFVLQFVFCLHDVANTITQCLCALPRGVQFELAAFADNTDVHIRLFKHLFSFLLSDNQKCVFMSEVVK